VHKADNLTAICELIVYRKYESLDISQPYGPSRLVTGIALPFFMGELKSETLLHTALRMPKLFHHFTTHGTKPFFLPRANVCDVIYQVGSVG
jgi:hypothetical protein